MQRKWEERSCMTVWGLLLSLLATPLWAGETARHELLDGLLTLEMPAEMEKSDEQAVPEARMVEFQSSGQQLLVGIILGTPTALEVQNLEELHQGMMGAEEIGVQWARDDWAGDGSERYFVIGGEAPVDNAAGGRTHVLTYGTAVGGEYLLVIVEYRGEDAWSEAAEAVIDSIAVRRE